jgi:hypothetical protein
MQRVSGGGPGVIVVLDVGDAAGVVVIFVGEQWSRWWGSRLASAVELARRENSNG